MKCFDLDTKKVSKYGSMTATIVNCTLAHPSSEPEQTFYTVAKVRLVRIIFGIV